MVCAFPSIATLFPLNILYTCVYTCKPAYIYYNETVNIMPLESHCRVCTRQSLVPSNKLYFSVLVALCEASPFGVPVLTFTVCTASIKELCPLKGLLVSVAMVYSAYCLQTLGIMCNHVSPTSNGIGDVLMRGQREALDPLSAVVDIACNVLHVICYLCTCNYVSCRRVG